MQTRFQLMQNVFIHKYFCALYFHIQQMRLRLIIAVDELADDIN